MLSKKKREVSKGGSEIFRHEIVEPENKEIRPPAPSLFIDEICAFFDKKFPNSETTVLHEVVSDLVHIDVHVLKPTDDRDFYVLYTTGMSDLPMNLPPQFKKYKALRRAELFMYIPADTDVSERDFWAYGLLKFLARFPHEYKTWLAQGHTIPNYDYEPIVEGSELSCAILLEMFEGITTKCKKGIKFYYVAPISEAETQYKLENGVDALIDKFDEHNVPIVVDIFRKSVAMFSEKA